MGFDRQVVRYGFSGEPSLRVRPSVKICKMPSVHHRVLERHRVLTVHVWLVIKMINALAHCCVEGSFFDVSQLWTWLCHDLQRILCFNNLFGLFVACNEVGYRHLCCRNDLQLRSISGVFAASVASAEPWAAGFGRLRLPDVPAARLGLQKLLALNFDAFVA